MELIERLEKRAKAGLSNPAEVTNELLELSLSEAAEIVDKKIVSDTTRLDIAYFRLMLMIKKNGIGDDELDLYKSALKIVKDSLSHDVITGESIAASYVKVKPRRNKWD
jgi:hypothetical protein